MLPCGRGRQGPLVINSPKVFFQWSLPFFLFYCLTATANESGMGDEIATLAKTHGFTITSDEVYAHADFIGQDGDLTDFELELISGGGRGSSSGC